MNTIVECIKEIKNEIGGNNWRVCFIPASTHHKTACRYQKLATFIEKETGIACDYHTILTIQDQESGHITGKKTNPAENFNIKTSQAKSSSSLTTSSQEEEPSKWLQKSWEPWGQQA